MDETNFNSIKRLVLDSISDVLIEKNKRYGNAALEPINVFYKGNATTSIAIRMDDKLSRIKNSNEIRKNDMFDLLGYAFLFAISNGFYNTNEKDNFIEKVNSICTMVDKELNSYLNEFQNIFFNKEQRTLVQLEFLIREFKRCDTEDIIFAELNKDLLCYLVLYFIENNIDNFTDLID